MVTHWPALYIRCEEQCALSQYHLTETIILIPAPFKSVHCSEQDTLYVKNCSSDACEQSGHGSCCTTNGNYCGFTSRISKIISTSNTYCGRRRMRRELICVRHDQVILIRGQNCTYKVQSSVAPTPLAVRVSVYSNTRGIYNEGRLELKHSAYSVPVDSGQ